MEVGRLDFCAAAGVAAPAAATAIAATTTVKVDRWGEKGARGVRWDGEIGRLWYT